MKRNAGNQALDYERFKAVEHVLSNAVSVHPCLCSLRSHVMQMIDFYWFAVHLRCVYFTRVSSHCTYSRL